MPVFQKDTVEAPAKTLMPAERPDTDQVLSLLLAFLYLSWIFSAFLNRVCGISGTCWRSG